MAAEIFPMSVAEIEASRSFPMLAKEYAAEAALIGLPPPVEKLAAYRAIEKTGVFQAFGAVLGLDVVGFLAVITPVIPHYGVAVSVLESFFVGKAYRGTGAGLRLLCAAQNYAKKKKSPGLLVSAPIGGQLADVLPRFGYHETNRVFFKCFP